MEQAGVELAQVGRPGCASTRTSGARWLQVDTARQELGSVHPKTNGLPVHLPWARKDRELEEEGKGVREGC